MGVMKSGLVALVGILLATVVLVDLAEEGTSPAQATAAAQTPGGGTPSTDAASGATASGTAGIVLKDIKFSPASLTVTPGTTVTWTNEDPMGHTVTPADPTQWGSEGSGNAPAEWLQEGDEWTFTFTQPGTYVYYCLPHASKAKDGVWKGMVGTITVSADGKPAPTPSETSFEMPTTSVVPSPIAPARQAPDADGIVRITLETREVVAKLADGTAYTFWTFDGTVPGPMVRVREGHTVEVTLTNAEDSTMSHSVDFHAVTGPGGGAKATQTKPGESTSFTFKAIDPGVYVYHCATPHIPSHVANGMYGLIVVEPKDGWPAVDREFYVVESEWYTTGDRGDGGLQSLSLEKMEDEDPEYFTLNGQVGALTGEGAMMANVGETVRIFFGVGGGVPSSFHVIGEVFDTVYMDGNDATTHNRQTILVPAAGSAMVDFKLEVPGDYALVDHTLTRAIDKGAVGILHVDGPEDHAIYHGVETPGSGH